MTDRKILLWGGTILALVLAVAGPSLAVGQDLGRLDFPTSGAAPAQEAFSRGVLWLHSFEYDRAREAFRDAQRRDPHFAMAHWGEAMTYNHPVWNEQDRNAARAALERFAPTAEARRVRTPTARERGYLGTVEILYGEGTKERRDTLYAEAMHRMVEQFPDDLEAKAFYALSLLGLSQGERNVSTYMRAAAIALEVFHRNPLHPGAAHYIIHSFDDPTHAVLGLEAARAYSKIAPDAPHAQHMTTHIFVAMGMWDGVVAQNIVASGDKPWRPGHYTAWLSYGYLQQGRFDDSRWLLDQVRTNLPPNARLGQRAYLAAMRSHYIIDTERWDSPVLQWSIELDDGPPGARASEIFVSTFSALKLGHPVDRAQTLAALAAATTEPSYAARILATELRGLFALRDENDDEGLELLREATALEDDMPFEFGPPVVVKPSHELLGEVLLMRGRPDEARAEFERALRLAPRRARALLGLGRASSAAGDADTALEAYRTLREIWHAADPDLDALAEAHRYIGTHQASEAR